MAPVWPAVGVPEVQLVASLKSKRKRPAVGMKLLAPGRPGPGLPLL